MSRRDCRVVVLLAAAILSTSCGGTMRVQQQASIGETASESFGQSGAHVYVIVFENKHFDQIIGPNGGPYVSSLAEKYALGTNYRAVAHPSQPNYLALFSGSTQGVTDDDGHDLDAPTIADQLTAAGRSWRVYAENVPTDCFTGLTASGGADGAGTYVRKHNPAISFASISADPRACANITDFAHFDPAAADYSLIIPNLCHDMHDCSVAMGDAWLRSFLPHVLRSDAYNRNGTVFITLDEEAGRDPSNRVPLIAIAEHGPKGAVANQLYTHYSLLRTVQDLLGIPCLANSCSAQPMSDLVSR